MLSQPVQSTVLCQECSYTNEQTSGEGGQNPETALTVTPVLETGGLSIAGLSKHSALRLHLDGKIQTPRKQQWHNHARFLHTEQSLGWDTAQRVVRDTGSQSFFPPSGKR